MAEFLIRGVILFFHGIDYSLAMRQYPVLSPRLSLKQKSSTQMKDRVHLLEQFGLEPVHMLQNSKGYSMLSCTQACLNFGDTVFVFQTIPLPLWQLSSHEIGAASLDLRTVRWIVSSNIKSYQKLRNRFKVPILLVNKKV
jgi:hypothetical protein